MKILRSTLVGVAALIAVGLALPACAQDAISTPSMAPGSAPPGDIAVALKSGKKIRWDAERELCVDSSGAADSEANQFIRREYRAPWKLPG